MKKKKAEVEEYESSLDNEEKILEGIRDSLKGKMVSFLTSNEAVINLSTYTDKTQVFHDQIEVK